MEPLEFTLAVHDFDQNLLPEDARQPGTEVFRDAVLAYYVDQFLPIGGSAIVGVDSEKIHVQWVPDGVASEPLEYVLTLLQTGRLKEAIPLLETLLLVDPENKDCLYNLGMALSDLGRLIEAKKHLQRLVDLNPSFANGWIALGVARQRSGDTTGAREALEKAVELEPENGYAHRNLGGVLGHLGRNDEALIHLRRAADSLPGDPAAQYGLAQALVEKGDADSLQEADGLLIDAIEIAGDSPISDAAKEIRSKIAQMMMRERTGGGPNMAAVMYCVGAMQRFDAMSVQEMQGVVMEIALLGQRGLDVNDSTPKYNLRSVPGMPFTGLQLMSMMYVGFKRIEPGLDIGFDLVSEYQAALQMHEMQGGKSS